MMPNFFIVGTAKAATTSLYHYLVQHPQIYMSSQKEPNFFCTDGRPPDYRGPGDDEAINRTTVYDPAAYQALFAEARGRRAVGEASTWYLYVPEAAWRIRQAVPDARILAVLRNPVQRAYSSYLHLSLQQRERSPRFADALRDEADRIRANWAPIWHYRSMGFYYDQVHRYIELFGPERVLVVLHEDVTADLGGVLHRVFTFLGVDPDFTPAAVPKHNATGVPKSSTVHALLHRPGLVKALLRPLLPARLRLRLALALRAMNMRRPALDPVLQRDLVATYRDDVLRLQHLLRRDLSSWLAHRT